MRVKLLASEYRPRVKAVGTFKMFSGIKNKSQNNISEVFLIKIHVITIIIIVYTNTNNTNSCYWFLSPQDRDPCPGKGLVINGKRTSVVIGVCLTEAAMKVASVRRTD